MLFSCQDDLMEDEIQQETTNYEDTSVIEERSSTPCSGIADLCKSILPIQDKIPYPGPGDELSFKSSITTGSGTVQAYMYDYPNHDDVEFIIKHNNKYYVLTTESNEFIDQIKVNATTYPEELKLLYNLPSEKLKSGNVTLNDVQTAFGSNANVSQNTNGYNISFTGGATTTTTVAGLARYCDYTRHATIRAYQDAFMDVYTTSDVTNAIIYQAFADAIDATESNICFDCPDSELVIQKLLDNETLTPTQKNKITENYLELSLELTPDMSTWLSTQPTVQAGILAYQIAGTYCKAQLNYIVWAMMNHGGDLDFYTDGIDEWEGEDSPYVAPPSNIQILNSYVPEVMPTVTSFVAETPWRAGHEYDPPNGIIPQDLRHGTSASSLLLSDRPLSPRRDLNQLPDNELLDNFNDLIHNNLLNLFLQPEATAYYNRWVAGTGGDFFLESLSEHVLDNEHMKAGVRKFGEELNRQLKAVNGDVNNIVFFELDVDEYRVKFAKGELTTGLKILINDTERLSVYGLSDYQLDSQTNEWTISLFVQVLDNFGLDHLDLRGFQNKILGGAGEGFASWWILQHQRDYVPFRTDIRTIYRIKGDLDDAN